MALSDGVIDQALELFAGVGAIRAKRMFGGALMYVGDVGFALLDDDVIYLKAGGEFADELEALGSSVWTYPDPKGGPPRKGSYWSLPTEALDDPDLAAMWGQRALDWARANAKPKRDPKPKSAAKSAKRPARR